MSNDKAKALVFYVNVCRKIVIYARFALGGGQQPSWRSALYFQAIDFPNLNTKFVG